MTKCTSFVTVAFTLSLTAACTPSQPTQNNEVPPSTEATKAPNISYDQYEKWTSDNVHFFRHGLAFDLGSSEADKYLEWHHNWLKPEWIDEKTANEFDMAWAKNRYVRWLSGTNVTFSFPMMPDKLNGDLTLHLMLRPKVNEAVSVKFYQTDDENNVAWTTPKSFSLKPGWNNNTVSIPRDWLNKSGDQLMRLTFPGSYFEGDQRVSAKFIRLEIQTSQTQNKNLALDDREWIKTAPCRVDNDERIAWLTANNDVIERFFVVPQNARFTFDMAPSPWLMANAVVSLIAYADNQEPELLFTQTIHPGDAWQTQNVTLNSYENKAIRLSLEIKTQGDDLLFPNLNLPNDAVCIADPQIQVKHDIDRTNTAKKIAKHSKNLIVIGIDNLRADRILNDDTRNVAPNLHNLLQHAVYGMALAESINGTSTTATLLTGVPLPIHGIQDDATHLKTSLQTLAEDFPQKKSFFYTTSNVIEPSRGFAQGFQTSRRLNKEKLGSPALAIQTLAQTISTANDNTLGYLHLGSLRLPLQPSDANFERFRSKDYSGPVNAQAMQNLAVLKDPSNADAKQFAAYYDAALADIDQALPELLNTLPQNTTLVIYGTHASSLGESTLGYQQTLAPWETIVPWIIYNRTIETPIKINDIISIQNLHHSITAILSNHTDDLNNTVFQTYPNNPVSYANGVDATATKNYFYRIRREGVDALFEWKNDEQLFKTTELNKHPITRRALREQMKPNQ